MASSIWMIRHKKAGARKSGKKSRHEDVLTSLQDLDPHETFKSVLRKICDKESSEEVLYNYLNAFVKLLLQYEDRWEKINFHVKDLLCCLRISLTHHTTQVRTMGIRCIRYLIKVENDVVQLNALLIPYLVSRSSDLLLKNDAERVEAMKLMRKCLIIAPSKFDHSMARCLISLAYEGLEAKDRMLRVCLATLSELGVLNSRLFIMSGGVTAITRNLIECQIPKIAESLCGVLLMLLDRPSTRHYAAVDLHCAAAPFCDFHFKHSVKDKHKRDERELRLNCGRLTLLTILRSWSGILHFCSPNDKEGFRAIIEVLYLKQLEVRKSVLDLLYELLGLPQPEWTDELSVALSAVDPCEPQATWGLNEGFIVAEGRSVLPHLAKTTPNVTDMHLALLLYCFLENGLLAALTEVIATSDTFICVRASVLLGEILRLIQIVLPPKCCNITPSLPSLLEYATRSKPQALAAITALEQLHMLMKRRPASYSLHLDYIIRNSYNKRMEHKHGKKHKSISGLRSKIYQVTSSIENLVLKDGDDAVKETGVLNSNDAYKWDWNVISILIKGSGKTRLNLNDAYHRAFVKKLIEFYTPSRNKYSHMDLGPSKTNIIYTTVGLDLINFLASLKEPDYNGFKPRNIILDFFKDILNNITAISTSRSVHDCLFSPQHMVNTHCQSYFLFIGQFSRTEVGLKMLEDIDLFTTLKHLATSTNYDCYVKLIISSIDILPDPCKNVFEAVLTCNSESSRLYATQFLQILLRAGNPLFSTWAIQLLVNQLYDKSRSVYLSALATLHEACELPDCLEALIDINPNLEKLGEKGAILFIRILSTESGFNKIVQKSSKDKIINEIERWNTHFIYRYVRIVEEDISDALTLHQRNEEGRYDKRAGSLKSASKKDVFLPPHLYGQISQHAEGFNLLLAHSNMEKMIETIQKGKCNSEDEIMNLKSSIWAMCHLGSSRRGYEYVSSYEVFDSIIRLASKASIYSIRAVAFYALGLLATTSFGATELAKKGWLCTRHNRHDYWPIIKEECHDGYGLGFVNLSLSDDVMSLDNVIVEEFEHEEEDDDTYYEEKQDCVHLPTHTSENPIERQSTLPANKKTPVVFHTRSLSESKTFDLNNSYEEDNRNLFALGRQRNSSMTESSTSGVSSCDSLPNKHGTSSYMKTLSPIPSSSSLSTLQIPPNSFTRVWHTRISSNSTTNSDVSSSSMTGSISNELSTQNLMGYNALKSLRRMKDLNFDEDWLKASSDLTPSGSSLIDDFRALNISITSSVFNVPKFEIESSSTQDDRRYMGICLPKNLSDIFPSQEEIRKEPYIFPESLSDNLEHVCSPDGNKFVFRHSKPHCFYCSQRDVALNIEDSAKIEILKNVERLANPISNKYIRSHLIRLKQREPAAFRDICVYSEICRIISESTYRLPARRLLYDLFFDMPFDCMYEKTDGIIEDTRERTPNPNLPQGAEERSQRMSTSSDISSPTESLRTLDSLMLTFNENKFPIRKKH